MSVPFADETDEQLMRRAQADEPNAFEHLYLRHAARAFRIARVVSSTTTRAEDAVQEGFLEVWRARASYRPASGSFQSWSMRIVRNRAIDFVRRDGAARRPPAADGRHAAEEPAPGSVQDDAIARDEAAALRTSLRRLPDAQAEVITLAFFGELSHSEIAAELSLPEGTVKGRMRLGLEKLRVQAERRG